MHALFFTFGPCKAVLQKSLIGWISVQSVLCPPCSQGLVFFLSYTFPKGRKKVKTKKKKKKYVYGKNIASANCDFPGYFIFTQEC